MILEIGANDGLFLKALANFGFNNLTAVDPSPQTSLIRIPGVKVVNKFFNDETMSGFNDEAFDTIIANNCFSHIPNLTGVMGLCRKLLKPKGVLIVEVQSTLDLIEGAVFDYIYHEHYFYHTVSSFDNLAKISGLEIICIKHVPTKGGSYRFLLGHPGENAIDSSVKYWKYREEVCLVNSVETWLKLNDYLRYVRESLNHWIDGTDDSILGYGACATGTVFISYMGLEQKIQAIVDDNPKRQGLFAPGTGIPVISLEQAEGFRRCLVLAWRHGSLILPKLTNKGVTSFVPLPFVNICGN
jgi:SAM-dependent methyltransferase